MTADVYFQGLPADLVDSELMPSFLKPTFADVQRRARMVLSGKGSHDVDEGALSASIMLGELLCAECEWESDSQVADLQRAKVDALRRDGASDTRVLYAQRHCFELDDPSGFSWSALFAVVALAHVFKAGLIDQIGVEDEHAGLPVGAWLVAQQAVEAVEAVNLAERLGTNNNEAMIDAEVRSRISLRAKKAARARHAPVDRLKSEFVAFYLAGNFQSMTKAANRFYEQLPPDRRRLMSSINAARTLREALSTYLRSQAPKADCIPPRDRR